MKGIGGFYYIDTVQGIYECRARGIFRKEGIRPTVGDSVQISVLDEANKEGSLDVILPRRTELIRPRENTAWSSYHPSCGTDSYYRTELYRGFPRVHLSVPEPYPVR